MPRTLPVCRGENGSGQAPGDKSLHPAHQVGAPVQTAGSTVPASFFLTDFLLGFSDGPARTEMVSLLSRLEEKMFSLKSKKNFFLQHGAEAFPDGHTSPLCGGHSLTVHHMKELSFSQEASGSCVSSNTICQIRVTKFPSCATQRLVVFPCLMKSTS